LCRCAPRTSAADVRRAVRLLLGDEVDVVDPDVERERRRGAAGALGVRVTGAARLVDLEGELVDEL